MNGIAWMGGWEFKTQNSKLRTVELFVFWTSPPFRASMGKHEVESDSWEKKWRGRQEMRWCFAIVTVV
jgi:hypothetical protein